MSYLLREGARDESIARHERSQQQPSAQRAGGAVMSTPPAKEPHYTKIGEWVSECGSNGMEAAVYQHLAKRLNHASGSRIVDPSRARLAADVGLKKPDDVDPYLRGLEALGAVVIHAQKGVRTKYELPLWPLEGYDGPANTHAADKWQRDDLAGYAAWRARRRALVDAAEAPYAAKRRARVAKSAARKRPIKTADVPVATGRSEDPDVPVVTGTHVPVVTGTHLPVATGTNQDDQNDQTNMGDGRRPTTGSSPLSEGGFAASDKMNPPSQKPKPADIRAVVDGIPAPLTPLLEKDWPRGLPDSVNLLITEGLLRDHRTAGQLVERMARRWEVFGYEDALLSQDGPGIRTATGVLEELLSASKCWGNNIDCEDGIDRNTDAPCPRCEEAREDRIRAAEPAPAAALVPQDDRPTFTPSPLPPPRVEIAEGQTFGVNAEIARQAREALRANRGRVPR
jgi:hypothetical protein